MAHNIAKAKDGRDSFAYVGKKAWHGLGQELPAGADLDTWACEAGLDWSVEMRPSHFYITDSEGNQKLEQSHTAFHCVRTDTQQSLAVMTQRYKPVQPREVLSFFKNFTEADDRFSIETAGALRGGAIIWCLAKFDRKVTAGGDDHVVYCMLTTSFNGLLATTAMPTLIRVVCNNTLSAAMYDRKAQVRIPHYRAWSDKVVSDAHLKLEKIASSFDQFKALGDAMAAVRMSREQVEDLFKHLAFKGVEEKDASGKAKGIYDSLFASWLETEKEGTQMDNTWASLNAVTRFVDHNRTTRRTNGADEDSSRMASSFYGSGAAMKKEALEYLAELGKLNLEDFMTV